MVAPWFMYLATIIDWHSLSILAWKLSNCMEAIKQYGAPEIVNTDRDSQYTRHQHIKLLKAHVDQTDQQGKLRVWRFGFRSTHGYQVQR